MKPCLLSAVFGVSVCVAASCVAEDVSRLAEALTLHASFDEGLDADLSKGDRACYVQDGDALAPAAVNDDVKIAPGAGRFGNAVQFTRKSKYWPLYKGKEALGYNGDNWDASVSLWLRLNPDKDLEPGYCDPVQIVGDDIKKGFIFLEWSKDHTPRHFRFAIWPLYEIWNPMDKDWEEIPAEKRPLVQLTRAPFSSDEWTHAVFTLENVNDKAASPVGRLYLNGEPIGAIDNWDLTLDWNPDDVKLVLGAAYVGYLDDFAVFNRTLTPAEVKQLHGMKNGVRDLYAK